MSEDTPRSTDCVLFDLDGTFADTAPDMVWALNALLVEENRQPLPFAAARPYVSRGSPGLVELGFGPGLDDVRAASLRRRFIELYRDHLCVGTTLFEGIAALLDDIDHAGLRWGIVTNKPAFLTEPLLDRLGVWRRAAAVVSGDTLPLRKPHPQPVLKACADAAVTPARTLFVGDDLRDVSAGRAAGTMTLVARYGYIVNGDDPSLWQADGVIDEPGQIGAWLRRPR